MLAVQLAAKSPRPLHVILFDKNGAFARGVAYGTKGPSHLLNVPAVRMGAFPDRIDDFYLWLQKQGSALTPDSFAPRMLYGNYIESLLEAAKRNTRDVSIETVTAEATDAKATHDGVTLTVGDGTEHTVSRLVLAIGSLAVNRPKADAAALKSPHYVGNIWAASRLFESDDPVLIIGTGLTTVDAIVSLRRQGFGGKIIALSRNGLLPQPHKLDVPSHPRFLPPDAAPHTAAKLLQRIRKEIKNAKDWRSVVDSLRADTPDLWAQLPQAEQKKLLRVLSFWNVHRHRMPPESAAMIEREIKKGTLQVLGGSILKISETGNMFSVQVKLKGGKPATLEAGTVLNCAGPNTAIAASGNALLLHLLEEGLITPGPLGLGLAADKNFRAKGKAPDRIFALGPQLVGERFETVAVPELRGQAEAVAESLLTSLNS